MVTTQANISSWACDSTKPCQVIFRCMFSDPLEDVTGQDQPDVIGEQALTQVISDFSAALDEAFAYAHPECRFVKADLTDGGQVMKSLVFSRTTELNPQWQLVTVNGIKAFNQTLEYAGSLLER
jgi:hypothetical protein